MLLLAPETPDDNNPDNNNNNNNNKNYKAGDCVRTIYGAGVITATPTDDDSLFYTVRLWRVPGQSIASAALARLTVAAVRACVHLIVLTDPRRHAVVSSLLRYFVLAHFTHSLTHFMVVPSVSRIFLARLLTLGNWCRVAQSHCSTIYNVLHRFSDVCQQHRVYGPIWCSNSNCNSPPRNVWSNLFKRNQKRGSEYGYTPITVIGMSL